MYLSLDSLTRIINRAIEQAGKGNPGSAAYELKCTMQVIAMVLDECTEDVPGGVKPEAGEAPAAPAEVPVQKKKPGRPKKAETPPEPVSED